MPAVRKVGWDGEAGSTDFWGYGGGGGTSGEGWAGASLLSPSVCAWGCHCVSLEAGVWTEGKHAQAALDAQVRIKGRDSTATLSFSPGRWRRGWGWNLRPGEGSRQACSGRFGVN